MNDGTRPKYTNTCLTSLCPTDKVYFSCIRWFSRYIVHSKLKKIRFSNTRVGDNVRPYNSPNIALLQWNLYSPGVFSESDGAGERHGDGVDVAWVLAVEWFTVFCTFDEVGNIAGWGTLFADLLSEVVVDAVVAPDVNVEVFFSTLFGVFFVCFSSSSLTKSIVSASFFRLLLAPEAVLVITVWDLPVCGDPVVLGILGILRLPL